MSTTAATSSSDDASSNDAPSNIDALEVRESGLGVYAFYEGEHEVAVISAKNAAEAAEVQGFHERDAARRIVREGRLKVQLLLKAWRHKDRALALYFRPTGWEARQLEEGEPKVWRVLRHPDNRHNYPLGVKGIDFRRLPLGARLTLELTDSKGWPEATGGRLEKGELLGDYALKSRPQTGPADEKKDSRQGSHRGNALPTDEIEVSPAGETEDRPGADAGGRSELDQADPDFIRKGVWTNREDGVISGILLATGKRVSDSVLTSAWREIQAYQWKEDHSDETIAEQLGVSKGTVRRYLERAERLIEQRYSPGARPELGLSAADVRAYAALKHGRSSSIPEEEKEDERRGQLFLVERKAEDGGRVTDGPYVAGDPRLEDARHWDDTTAILRSTGLDCEEGEPLFEHDRVRPDPSMDSFRITWSQRHLRWQAGEDFSLAQLDAVAREHFGAEGLERLSRQDQ